MLDNKAFPILPIRPELDGPHRAHCPLIVVARSVVRCRENELDDFQHLRSRAEMAGLRHGRLLLHTSVRCLPCAVYAHGSR